jgi:hypothetical protein
MRFDSVIQGIKIPVEAKIQLIVYLIIKPMTEKEDNRLIKSLNH